MPRAELVPLARSEFNLPILSLAISYIAILRVKFWQAQIKQRPIISRIIYRPVCATQVVKQHCFIFAMICFTSVNIMIMILAAFSLLRQKCMTHKIAFIHLSRHLYSMATLSSKNTAANNQYSLFVVFTLYRSPTGRRPSKFACFHYHNHYAICAVGPLGL